jgi:hypothetical protein
MRPSSARCVLLSALALLAGVCGAADVSELWGATGEKWNDDSRLPGFSFAGYRCGEKPIPTVPVVTDVKKHGAQGDGKADDTKAFLAAIKAAKEGAVFVPEGRYVLTDTVDINKRGVVLRGAGPDKTVLVVPKPLAEIHPAENVDSVKSRYSFTGGFVTLSGSAKGKKIGEVTAPAKRGDRQLALSTTKGIAPGTFIRLTMNNEKSLGRHIHADLADAGKATGDERKNFVDWAARVAAVNGDKVELDRPLRLDVRLEWKPEISLYQPTVEESGIEDLGLEFPGVPKKEHLKEEGYNAIQFRGASNCWVRNVTVIDADNGIIVGGSRFCRFENVRFKAAKRTGMTGHHALWATGGSQDCLFTSFRMDTTYVHDLTAEGFANGNVFSKGSGVAVNFDHHRNAPYENLFTDIDVGDPKRVWASSGRGDRGPHAGARETFWNIRGSKGKFPKLPDFPQVNIVGVPGYATDTTKDKQWVEHAGPVEPADLHESQLQRRLGRKR